MPSFASPLSLIPTLADPGPLTLADCSALAKIQVRAEPDGAVRAALATPFAHTTHPARASRTAPTQDPASRGFRAGESGISDDVTDALAGTLVVGAGPGEWLVLGPPGVAASLRTALTALAERVEEFASVVELTHGRALVRLTGADSPVLLAKLCALDLSDAATPDGSALRSSVARVVTDLIRDDRPDGTRSYLLHCERSSGAYLAGCLLDAGAEFAIAVTSPDPTEADRP